MTDLKQADQSSHDRTAQPQPSTPLTQREQTPNQPQPNEGTMAAPQHPQTQPEEEQQKPIPNQAEEDEKLTEYLVKEEGLTRPSAESELAMDRHAVVLKKKQFDQDQQKKKDQQGKGQDQQAKGKDQGTKSPQQEQHPSQGLASSGKK